MPNYSGIWTEQAVMQAVGAGNWPGNPGAPTIGTATGGNVSASVTFTAPTNNGGSAITSYTVTSSPGGVTGTGASSPITVSGLTNGTAYTFTVTATNGTGTGPASAASNSVTPAQPNYVEEVFSTYLYTGTGSSQTITNGIDLSTKGGLVWLKDRTNNDWGHSLFDTARGAGNRLISSSTAAQSTGYGQTFTTSGFGLDSSATYNWSGDTFVGWTFRKQPKFFDIVTYTGNATNRRISHSLGSTPGFIIVKCTSTARNWYAWHRSLTPTTEAYMLLNGSSSVTTGDTAFWGTSAPTSTDFGVGGAYSGVNANGDTFVAYLFAHDAGGFGLTGTDNVISCGTFTTNASSNATISLGWEPQWVLFKSSSSSAQGWKILDNMRGFPAAVSSGPNAVQLIPNSSAGETGFGQVGPTATGWGTTIGQFGLASETYIYIAIRRGPMKVPTSGTSVFSPVTYTGNSTARTISVTARPDVYISKSTTNTAPPTFFDRLRGVGRTLFSSDTSAERNITDTVTSFNNLNVGLGVDTSFGYNSVNFTDYGYVAYGMTRAPSFFDEVCYTGDGVNGRQISHNLTVAPELMIFKRRTVVDSWTVMPISASNNMFFNTTAAMASNGQYYFGDNTTAIQPTSTYFTVSDNPSVNNNTNTMVAYLFATCAGVSKVGSYTGNGSTQTIDCGFGAGGARFVLIKRTDSTGDWYVYDTARGMTTLTDPYFRFNLQNPDTNTLGSVTTVSTGFALNATILAAINTNAASYIFLAIA